MGFIEFSNINLKYGEKRIFKNYSLPIEEGEKVLISGRSGNGKSTLLCILLGFASFDNGELFIRDKLVTPANISRFRNMFAYVNQDVTLRPGNIRKVLEEISKFSNNEYSGGFDEELAARFEFDLDLLNKEIEELSGGERQRLGIILAIMLNRPVFLLDEVTSSLDENLKYKVAEYFASCEKTVISVSHDRDWIESGKFRKVEWK